MTSTGNDIVALSSINIHRTKQERFYSKILSPAEVELYAGSNSSNLNFENFIWLLWSVKESVYKFSKRNFPHLNFSPAKMTVQSITNPLEKYFPPFGTGEIENISLQKEECCCCVINTATGIYYSRSKMYNEIIYTIVNDTDNFDSIWWGIKYIDDANPVYQSESVRAFVLEKFNAIYPNANLSIVKNPAGYPVLKANNAEMKIPLSFTHHDRFVAYSFMYSKQWQCKQDIIKTYQKFAVDYYEEKFENDPKKLDI